MFLWTSPDDYPESLIGTYDRKASPDRFLFKQGRRLEVPDVIPVVRFDCSTSELRGIDDLVSSAMVPIVSERIQELLRERAGQDVQLVDVHVRTRDGELSGYRIVNVTTLVKTIDHSASEYTLIPGTNAIMGFRKLVVFPDALGQHALARDAEYKSNLMVSDPLGEFLKGLRLGGVGLYRPEEMTW
jgi:hypothetical protein